MTIVDLYTQTDVKRIRELLITEQKGLCAITKQPLIKPCLDHTHDQTQLVRGVISNGVNLFLGKIENGYLRYVSWWCDIPLPKLLRNIADYLEFPNEKANIYRHNFWLRKIQTLFASLPEGSKRSVLKSLGCPEGNNSTDRKKLFQSVLTSRQHSFVELKTMIESEKQKEKV